MSVVLTPEDLKVFDPDIPLAKAEEMIADALAQASLVAPCLLEEDSLSENQIAQFKSVLRSVVLRFNERGPENVTTEQASFGPYQQSITVDNRQRLSGMFWPSEKDLLRAICGSGKRSATHDLAGPTEPPNLLAGAQINGPLGVGPGGL
ncbi:MAG: hypothetical protein FWG47_05020 [Propionibacteriaceae bacterium]|nr:hypothetical protein [Propionibacteriaceae bacterium]